MLHGRGAETEAIAALLATSQNGRSGVLVIRGEAGIGKTALLDWAAQQAMPAPSSTAPGMTAPGMTALGMTALGMTAPGMTAPGMTVLRSTGIETEAELPFAGLHLLLRPVLGRLDALPARQAEALSRAFFLVERDSQGGDDRFLVGLAVLSLLAEAGPVLCLIDDANWLDAGSAEALLFAARRLEAEGVVMIFAARDGEARPFPAAGLPECSLAPLTAGPASRLIDERVPALDQGLRDRVLTDAQGNPLALAELAGALLTSAADGRSAEPGPLAATRRVRERFAAEIRALGDQAKLGLLVAAAEGSGGTQLILDAAGRLGAGPGALTPAESAGLITVTQRITFRHPLIRSAAYYEAPLALRQAAHRALAAALQPGTADDDRRAWHQAAAATGADEQIAAELVRAAEHARERGGYTAVAAAYGRAAQLTPDPAARARRLLAGAAAATDVGQADWAVQLADEAQQLCDDPLVRAEAAYLRTLGHAGEHDSLVRLGTAAVAIAEEYPPRAAELLGRVLNGAWASSDHPLAAQTADQLRHLPLPSGTLRQADQALLQQVLFLAGDGAANRSVISAYLMAVRANPGSARPHERLTATVLAFHVGDLDALSDISGTLVADCRAGGLIGWLAGALQGLAMSQVIRSDWADARASATEGLHLADDTGHQRRATFMLGMLGVLAALTGDEHQCRSMLAEQRRRGGADPAYEHNLGSQLGLLELSRARFSSATERFASASLSKWVPVPAGYGRGRDPGRPARPGPACPRRVRDVGRLQRPALGSGAGGPLPRTYQRPGSGGREALHRGHRAARRRRPAVPAGQNEAAVR
jgi:hypothetical protein